MFCPNCGAQSPDGSQFCGQCGMALAVQPNYGQLQYGQPIIPVKKSNVPIVVGAICAALLAVFLMVLFVVIIPNAKGDDVVSNTPSLESRLAHKWSYTEDGVTGTYDFKNNLISVEGFSLNMNWKVTGSNTISITTAFMGSSETNNFKVEFGSGDRTLTLTPTDNSDNAVTFKRAD